MIPNSMATAQNRLYQRTAGASAGLGRAIAVREMIPTVEKDFLLDYRIKHMRKPDVLPQI